MQTKRDINQFSPSVNIDRDSDRDLVYYPTENARRICQQILGDFKAGIHVFSIVGSYGSGKSSFLWALEQNLLHGKPYFSPMLFEGRKVEILRLVGDYSPLSTVIAEAVNEISIDSSNAFFSKLYYKYRDTIQDGLLVILIDEFGKFLEYAAEHQPEKELYFLQQLAEFVSKPEYNILFLSTVHQNFDAYSFGLQSVQRQEWAKVKGRFKELTFNEPVEQLLRLAADYLHTGPWKKDADDEMLALQIADLFKRSMAFDLSANLSSEIALDLLPLDLWSASALTLTLQRYGQNERSLFSFLISSDHTSLLKVARHTKQYHLGHVYDYLLFNFYSFLQSRYNPDYAAWRSIHNILDEVDRTFDVSIAELSALVKTIGLLHLTSAQGSKLDEAFLVRYASICLGITDPHQLIQKLRSKNLIIFSSHLQRFTLNEGTPLDMQAALIMAASQIEQINDVATLLKRYYALPSVLAKNYTYETGTPRVFEFVISDKLHCKAPTGETDGYIYLLFNEKLTREDVAAYSSTQNGEANIYVFYENSRSIKDLLFELEKLRKVKEENNDDKVAVRLLNESIEASQRTLNHFILGSLHSGSQHLSWFWNGKAQTVSNKRSFNQLLSTASREAYPFTPVFQNELANKHKISPSIATARKNYFKALVKNWNQADIGFETDKFPPEKTIYLSLIKENHISIVLGDISQEEDSKNIAPLWAASLEFLNSSKDRRKTVAQFIDILSVKPFKLKQGLITFWVPTFLFIKRDEFALFGENGYVPFMTEETLDLIIRYPEKYEIKAFDLEGVKLELFNRYRRFLQQPNTDWFDNQTFIDTIRPFLSFYRSLPKFTRATRRNLSKEAIALRNVIAVTEDLEKTFFEDFPAALGYSMDQLTEEQQLAEKYLFKLELTIKEIRGCYEKLVGRFEQLLSDRILGRPAEFLEYKEALTTRYNKLKSHLVRQEQKTFLQRITSDINDRKAWLNSIAQVLTGKQMENFNDGDELLLQENFLAIIGSLDSLFDLTTGEDDLQSDDVLGFEIRSFIDGVNKTIVRLPKSKRAEVAAVELALKKAITKSGGNNQLNIVALANVIKELIQP
ncbi:hypothetical protein L0663_10270 [Dyadobacter sp. CY107]|uniref:hypothetical protein n=1 Tax=Dyadobacter fanqingshengii TaxID=2906443 RepID=UPI001F2A057D|nr:hypothetical protein [Dyadobacter fanqingshengii]MCF2503762.1 hypothetical protein [Dyadobacter fanqingshengii]